MKEIMLCSVDHEINEFLVAFLILCHLQFPFLLFDTREMAVVDDSYQSRKVFLAFCSRMNYLHGSDISEIFFCNFSLVSI